MQTFLTKTAQKKVRLVHFLLVKNKWRTMEELCSFLQVSSKSILLYLEELAQLFAASEGKIRLLNQDNQRFFVEKNENYPIYSIYLHYYKHSYNYQLLDFMFKQPEKNLEDFAQAQFTSVSTVFRYSKLLVGYFKKHKIHFHSFKLLLEAKEETIRSFYYYFYWDSTRNGGWPFLIEEAQVADYVEQFQQIYRIFFTPLQKRTFAYWLAVILQRSADFPVQVSQQDQALADQDVNFPLIQDWLKQAQLTLPEEEVYFIYKIVYSFGIIDGNAHYETEHAKAHQAVNSLSFQAVQHLAQTVQRMFAFSLDLADPELIFNFTAFHERSRFYYGSPDIFFQHSYQTEVKQQQPKVFETMERFKQELITSADQKLKMLLENWEQLFLDYYYLLDYYGLLLNSREPIKIWLQDDLHHTHRLWLMHKIEGYFGKAYSLAFFDYQTAVDEVDLVISNYYLDTGDRPLLLMKNIPTERNWRQLEKLLYQAALKK